MRRRPHEKFLQECVEQRVKHPVSVMIWSVISGRGVGDVYFVEGTMRANQYCDVINNVLLPQMERWFGSTDETCFMQDLAPCHTAKIVKKLFGEKKLRILDWAPSLPDMNPIENVWAKLKQKVSQRNITTKAQLVQAIKEIWTNDQEINDMAINCIKSMPNRVAALLKSKGSWTKY